ncbi:MAG: dihydrolipoyl dehydrogenase [Alphaproteobacteria bacterium]|jgi:dihydrolipoamide dehydrogenase|nr:dihydrolipoyl dehydrogenase [Alphaproteobacteria bacterium]MDP6515203.1 dihydrolipoyl dehydrogenase [Alphaproteobacteria bacterium]
MVVGQVADPVDLLIAGAGPGGYAAALRGAQLGRRVTLVDRDGTDGVGGVCLRVGCIPSKALIEVAELAARIGDAGQFGLDARLDRFDMTRFQTWKGGVVDKLCNGVRGLLKSAGVDIVAGELRLTGPDGAIVNPVDGQARFLTFKDLILATGSRPTALADLPFDGKRVLDSTGALAMAAIPKRLAIVGAGYIGLEIGTAFAKLGSQVTMIEVEDRILPAMDPQIARPVARNLDRLGIKVLLGARALGHAKGKIAIAVGGTERMVAADTVVIAVGRMPNGDDLGLDAAGLETGAGGLLAVAADRRLAPHIAAIGDLTPGPALAHKATAEAAVAVEALSGKRAAFAPAAIPAVVFSDPEIATAGLTAAEAADQGMETQVATVPLSVSGRAATLGAGRGFAQIVADKADGTVVGVHLTGPHASELIGEGVLAIEMGATLEDLALAIHAHPTLSEQWGEAADLALGRPLHMSLAGGA